MHEIWRAIDGFDGYEVSSLGRVRRTAASMSNAVAARLGRVDHVLKHNLKSGYPHVRLAKGGEKFDRHIHTLVATAFHGPCPNDQECRHLNGNRQDNRPENLRWGSRAENRDDNFRLGVYPRGIDNKRSKLTVEVVCDMRRRRSCGEPIAAIAERYNVNYYTAEYAIIGKSWGHVPGALKARGYTRRASKA